MAGELVHPGRIQAQGNRTVVFPQDVFRLEAIGDGVVVAFDLGGRDVLANQNHFGYATGNSAAVGSGRITTNLRAEGVSGDSAGGVIVAECAQKRVDRDRADRVRHIVLEVVYRDLEVRHEARLDHHAVLIGVRFLRAELRVAALQQR